MDRRKSGFLETFTMNARQPFQSRRLAAASVSPPLVVQHHSVVTVRVQERDWGGERPVRSVHLLNGSSLAGGTAAMEERILPVGTCVGANAVCRPFAESQNILSSAAPARILWVWRRVPPHLCFRRLRAKTSSLTTTPEGTSGGHLSRPPAVLLRRSPSRQETVGRATNTTSKSGSVGLCRRREERGSGSETVQGRRWFGTRGSMG